MSSSRAEILRAARIEPSGQHVPSLRSVGGSGYWYELRCECGIRLSWAIIKSLRDGEVLVPPTRFRTSWVRHLVNANRQEEILYLGTVTRPRSVVEVSVMHNSNSSYRLPPITVRRDLWCAITKTTMLNASKKVRYRLLGHYAHRDMAVLRAYRALEREEERGHVVVRESPILVTLPTAEYLARLVVDPEHLGLEATLAIEQELDAVIGMMPVLKQKKQTILQWKSSLVER